MERKASLWTAKTGKYALNTEGLTLQYCVSQSVSRFLCRFPLAMGPLLDAGLAFDRYMVQPAPEAGAWARRMTHAAAGPPAGFVQYLPQARRLMPPPVASASLLTRLPAARAGSCYGAGKMTAARALLATGRSSTLGQSIWVG